MDDGEDLTGWAYEEFLDMGFSLLESLGLVVAGVSPSELRELVRHGADRETAASILI